MKKLISLLTLAGLLTFATATFAQDEKTEEQAAPAQTEAVAQDEPMAADEAVPEAKRLSKVVLYSWASCS